jgi:hypothetical protein
VVPVLSQLSLDSGDSWVPWLPYRGVQLHAIKITCAPTTSQTQSSTGSATASQTQTPSVTQSMSRTLTSTVTQSPSQTQSRSRTQTQSASQSVSGSTTETGTLSPSGTGTPSATVTPTPTQTLSSSQTSSASQSQSPSESRSPSQSATPSQSSSATSSQSRTPSQSQSASSTGFPRQVVLDNTAVSANSINDTSSRALSSGSWRAFSFYLPEDDPVCGPGIYRLSTLTLPLGLASGSVSLAVLLYPASSSMYAPLTSFIRSTVLSLSTVQNFPSYASLPLPANWLLNATQLRYFSIVLRTTSSSVGWFDAFDGTAEHAPVPGFAQPVGAFMSADVGASWTPEASYAGLALMGRKLVCRWAQWRVRVVRETISQ